MKTEYKGYELTVKQGWKLSNGDFALAVVTISLDGEEVGDDCPDQGGAVFLGDDSVETTLEDAIKWIEEDIRCRQEEEEDRYYLKTGDVVFNDGANGILQDDNTFKFVDWHMDGIFYFDGSAVEFDKDDKPFVSR